MENFAKILASIVAILSMLIGGAKIANDQIKIKRREKEIEDNDTFDDKIDNDIRDGDTDSLNDDFEWGGKNQSNKSKIEKKDNEKYEKTVDEINSDLGWTDHE